MDLPSIILLGHMWPACGCIVDLYEGNIMLAAFSILFLITPTIQFSIFTATAVSYGAREAAPGLLGGKGTNVSLCWPIAASVGLLGSVSAFAQVPCWASWLLEHRMGWQSLLSSPPPPGLSQPCSLPWSSPSLPSPPPAPGMLTTPRGSSDMSF